MKLSRKVAVDLANGRLLATESIRPTECVAWCSRNYAFSLRTTEYAYKKQVSEALQGYKELPNFDLVELATHTWFAGRTSIRYAKSLLGVGLEGRQRTSSLTPSHQEFIAKFSQALGQDIDPIVRIICDEYSKVADADESEACDASRFPAQLANSYEWVAERSLDFEASPLIPKGMKSLGTAVLVPFIDAVPHASKAVNTVVCVTSNDCNKSALESWAQDVDVGDPDSLHRPILLLATRKINKDSFLFRDCVSRQVGVTSGRDGEKLPVMRLHKAETTAS